MRGGERRGDGSSRDLADTAAAVAAWSEGEAW